jgi:hypothetical protein
MLIPVPQFQQLLSQLHSTRPDICIRYRLIGEMWSSRFLSVYHVSNKGALFLDPSSNRIFSVAEFGNIMQFEIDKSFAGLQPYFHYEINPLVNAAKDDLPVAHF